MGIVLGGSVGANGTNAPVDVAAVGGALVGIGPQNGGVFGPPLSLDALADAIRQFQSAQGMGAPDGKVDPGGNTLRRLNAILFPDEVGISELTGVGGLVTSVNTTVWAPQEDSLVRDLIFDWEPITGVGTMFYFQLAEQTVPRWFGVLVPDGTTEFDRVHIFFHPTPAQAGYQDAVYHTPGAFTGIFHYLSESFGTLFCAANSGRILVMPLMTQASAADCGTFPARWANYLGVILGRLATGAVAGAPFQPISSVVLSSFSSGIVYSHQFRARTNLGSRLAAVVDFDGMFSTYANLSQQVTNPGGLVIKAQQSTATAQNVPVLAAQNVFPVPRPRWAGPWANSFDPNPQAAALQVHAVVAQTMIKIAAERAC